LQNPSHSYTTAGTYTVNLSATDANPRIASASALTITVSPALSVSDGAGASVGNTPLAVSFTSTPSGGLAPYSYAWTFGDGAGSTLQNPSHTYTAAGVDTVNVTVTDANGATASTSALTITAIGPLSVAASATPTIGDAPLTTTLNGSATGGKAPYSYAWDLGDGTVSTAMSPSHAYSSVGTYTATVTVSDASGQVSHASAQVAVYPALTVSTLATPASGLASLQVTFTAIANGGLVPYAFAWTYGDGATGSSANGAHSYAAGTFHPTLTVHDAAGGTWSGSAGTITVTSPAVIPPATTPSPPAPAEASPSPETTPSPAAEPSVSPPATPTTGDHNSAPGAGNNGIHVLLLLFGSLFATGLGGALFVRWLRHRIGR
jgi:PKD repeat protein